MSDVRYLIRDRTVAADDWLLLPATADGSAAHLPDGRIIVPLNVWLAQADAIAERNQPFGVCHHATPPHVSQRWPLWW